MLLFSSPCQAGDCEKLMGAEKPVWVDRMQRMGKMVRSGVLSLMAGATLLLAVGGNILAGAERAATPTLAPSKAEAQARVKAAAMSLPLRFEKNVGQVKGADADDVRYVSRGSAYSLFLTSTEAVLEVGRRRPGSALGSRPVVVRMRLAGGSPAEALTGMDEMPGKSNYFIGNDPSQWHTGVPNYARVAEKGVYPGIDFVYHGNQGQLEYDFDVAPQADPGRIRLALEGAQGLRIDSQGDLLVKVEGGDLCFRQPVAYQRTKWHRTPGTGPLRIESEEPSGVSSGVLRPAAALGDRPHSCLFDLSRRQQY